MDIFIRCLCLVTILLVLANAYIDWPATRGLRLRATFLFWVTLQVSILAFMAIRGPTPAPVCCPDCPEAQ